MRLLRRKPKFTHPCPVCQAAGRVHPHHGQHAVSEAPESGPPLTGPPPTASQSLLGTRGTPTVDRDPVTGRWAKRKRM
jgi:hypothetical protein